MQSIHHKKKTPKPDVVSSVQSDLREAKTAFWTEPLYDYPASSGRNFSDPVLSDNFYQTGVFLPTQSSNRELVYYPTSSRSQYFTRTAANSNSDSYYLPTGGFPTINYGDVPSNPRMSSPAVENVTEPFFDFTSNYVPSSQPITKPHYNHSYHSTPSSGAKERSRARIPHSKPKRSSSEQMVDEVDLGRLESGDETRTCIMLRNIPNRYRREQIASVLFRSIGNNFNIMSMPCDPQTDRNLGYCFVQFASPNDVIKAYKDMQNQHWPNSESRKVCQFCYARIQTDGRSERTGHRRERPHNNRFTNNQFSSILGQNAKDVFTSDNSSVSNGKFEISK